MENFDFVCFIFKNNFGKYGISLFLFIFQCLNGHFPLLAAVYTDHYCTYTHFVIFNNSMITDCHFFERQEIEKRPSV